MLSQKNLIKDIETHCQNKRLKKNIYKMDCLPLKQEGGLHLQQWNPDPVLDYQFKVRNAFSYNNIMATHAKEML